MKRKISLSKRLPPVTQLGLATRGDNPLSPDDVAWAVERGLNCLNWCIRPDALSRYVRGSGRLSVWSEIRRWMAICRQELLRDLHGDANGSPRHSLPA